MLAPYMNVRELTAVTENDELLQLQLRVARRADELATARTAKTTLNLHCWLMAETEVLGRSLLDQPGFMPRSAVPTDLFKQSAQSSVPLS